MLNNHIHVFEEEEKVVVFCKQFCYRKKYFKKNMALSAGAVEKHESDQPTITASASDASDNESDGDSSAGSVEGNVGWANSISKVLGTTKPKTKKTLVLSRAKKNKTSKDAKPEADYDFEIDGEIKTEESKPDKTELDEKINHRRNMPLQLRVKPTWKDLERERILRRVATRGVVQLFNAVRAQQKDLQKQLDKAGPLDSRQDAVLNNINKRKFLDVLMSGIRAQSQPIDNAIKREYKDEVKSESSDDDGEDMHAAPSKKNKSEWNVLREDFMTNKKLKHWDEADQSDNSDAQAGTDGGTDDDEEKE